MKPLSCIALCMILLLKTALVCADIYMYLDSDGILHFTNTPTSSDYKLYIKEKPKKLLPEEAMHR